MTLRFRLAVLAHDLDRLAVEPARYRALRLLPRAVVYWVLIRAGGLDRGMRPGEIVPDVTFVTVLRRWAKNGAGFDPAEDESGEIAGPFVHDDGTVTPARENPDGSITLAAGDAAWLNVLLDNARPVEDDGPMAWGERGLAYGKAMIGYPKPLGGA